MYPLKAYLNLADGSTQDYQISVKTQMENQVCAVYLDAISQKTLDSQCGAIIEFYPEDMKSFVADYRHTEYWCCPQFGALPEEIPDETQGLIYQKTDGTYSVVLPVVSEQYKCVLAGSKSGAIQAKLFSWYEKLNSCRALAFLYAEGDDPYLLLEKCTEIGLKLLNTGCRTRKQRRYPELFEYLGWCSWDAFEIRVSEENLLKKCQEFLDKKIPVKWAIIDDMWAEVHDFYNAEYADRAEMCQMMHSSKLYSFQADPIRFPNGLKECIKKMNSFGVTVGMWHPTTGYWMGIDPAGDLFSKYRDCLIQAEDGSYVHDYVQEKAYLFYNAFHEYLRKSGAEFVKIDNQSMCRRFYQNLAPVGEVARQFHNAMEASVGQHFDNQMINCMGMANEDMWNRSVSPISRCSDDFLPEDKEWFTKHILQCAYNCLIQGQFYYCDWDMWWTDDEQAVKNSIIRAVSGGPIYVSDQLNRSNAEILMPLILSDGKILRCDRPGMPSKDCLTQNPTINRNLFKIQNQCNDSGVIAVFNLDEKECSVSGFISPSDVEGITGERFAVYEHFSGDFQILNYEEKFAVTLMNRDEYKLYIIVPLRSGCTMIGRIDKYISPKTVSYTLKGQAELMEEGPYAYVENEQLFIIS